MQQRADSAAGGADCWSWKSWKTVGQFTSCKAILISATSSGRMLARWCVRVRNRRFGSFDLYFHARFSISLNPLAARLNCYTFRPILGIFLPFVRPTASLVMSLRLSESHRMRSPHLHFANYQNIRVRIRVRLRDINPSVGITKKNLAHGRYRALFARALVWIYHSHTIRVTVSFNRRNAHKCISPINVLNKRSQ